MQHDMEGALIIEVIVTPDPSGVLYAKSPHFRGLHVCANDMETLSERVVKSIKAIFRHSRKLDVDVFPEAGPDFPAPKPAADRFIVHRA